MVEVYFYIPAGDVEDAVSCGIKLTDWYDKEVEIEGVRKKCISALLNPRDDTEKSVSSEYRCLKLEIMPKYCYIADSMLYDAGLKFPEIMDIYRRSMVPVKDYVFGNYRLPECLVTCTVLSDQVSMLDGRLDSPVLYGSSEELYMNNIIESFREIHDDFNDAMLYFFFSGLTADGKVRKLEGTAGGVTVFEDPRDNRIYTVKIPDLERY